MDLMINGRAEQVPDGITAAQLVEHLDLAGQRLAMEVHREIIPRGSFATYYLRAGDVVEIVRAIGGGCR
jgi:sulfur carrier protein